MNFFSKYFCCYIFRHIAREALPLAFIFALTGAWTPLAMAHSASDSFFTLELKQDSLSGRLDLALRDLEYLLSLDDNQDGAITWGELRAHRSAISAYVSERLSISRDAQPCEFHIRDLLVDIHSDGAYAVLQLEGACPKALQENDRLSVVYRMFFDADPQHRGLFDMTVQGLQHIGVFTPGRTEISFEAGQSTSAEQAVHFLKEGILHIWGGFDHILFLLALLFPAVLQRDGKSWHGASSYKKVLIAVAGTVTAFTIAHSITLALSVMHVVVLPSRFIESVIALSVALAALNNLYPLCRAEKVWAVAFVFGLMHGLAFAEVLRDLRLSGWALGISLISFNVGVELGQLSVISLFLPLAYALRHTRFYRTVVLHGASLGVFFLAMRWFVQRAF